MKKATTVTIISSVLAVAACLSQPLTAQSSKPAARPAAPKRDPQSPTEIGRTELVEALDRLAADETAARRKAIAAITTRGAAQSRQAAVRAKILTLLGGLPDRTPLNPQVTGSTQADGFRIEKIVFESQPGYRVTALLYLPDHVPAGHKLPAILIAPGHGLNGKAGDYFTSATFARNGFAVLSYDPIGQGERLEYPDPADPSRTLASSATGEHGEASIAPMLLGDAVARFFIWDAMRAIDYLGTRPEVDAKRIGAFGCSGGGVMTAMIAALDTRVAATGVACYNTSFDTLLPSIGPQDGEQSIPGFIAAGLDFPDWIELVAPRPYAAIATYSDMFPFAGARTTVAEARRFYSLFNPAAAGTPVPGTTLNQSPTEPALNVDTANAVPLTAPLQFITGPGTHGALAPIMDKIVGFFLRNLQPGLDADHPEMRPQPARGTPTGLPQNALQVTTTGQVLSSYPGEATIMSLTQPRAARLCSHRTPPTAANLPATIRKVTGAAASPGATKSAALSQAASGPILFPSGNGVNLRGTLAVPSGGGRHPAVLMLLPESIDAENPRARANRAEFERLSAAGNLVLAITPSPSPGGTDDMKTPALGPFYLLSLRADLVGRTLLGLRTDDTLRLIDALAARPDVDPGRIAAQGSGHMGLVLMHAAVLDPRLKTVTVDHVLGTYQSLLDAPMPTGTPEDVLPGVLLHYDVPDLRRSLGPRLVETDILKGTDDLSQTSTPLSTLQSH